MDPSTRIEAQSLGPDEDTLLDSPSTLKPFFPEAPEDIPANRITVDISDLVPPTYDGPTDLMVLHGRTFRPDQWSRAFQRGLNKVDMKGARVVEPGVGTGFNPLVLFNTQPGIASFRGSDLHEDVVDNARANLINGLPEEQLRKVALEVDDLSKGLPPNSADVYIGCLPQVIKPEGIDINEGEASAHYYERDRYRSDFNIYGLGLNEAALLEAKRVLTAEGKVVLNLSGRPGITRLRELFEANGFAPRVLHKELIAQHEGTSLSSLATLEVALGWPFEFFTDAQGSHEINAAEAEERRLRGEPVFHYIYVIEGTFPQAS